MTKQDEADAAVRELNGSDKSLDKNKRARDGKETGMMTSSQQSQNKSIYQSCQNGQTSTLGFQEYQQSSKNHGATW